MRSWAPRDPSSQSVEAPRSSASNSSTPKTSEAIIEARDTTTGTASRDTPKAAASLKGFVSHDAHIPPHRRPRNCPTERESPSRDSIDQVLVEQENTSTASPPSKNFPAVTVTSRSGPDISDSIREGANSIRSGSVHKSVGRRVSSSVSDTLVSSEGQDDATIAMRMEYKEYGIEHEAYVRSATHWPTSH